jgi:spore coat polysaccharide biosynthesis predicted glycosyltransferase SpsG
MDIHVICSGSTTLGLGHLFRARAFGRAIAGDANVRLTAIADPSMSSLFRDLPFPVSMIEFESELTQANLVADITVLDTVTLDRGLMAPLRRMSRLVASLSPVFDQMDAVDCAFFRHHPTEAQKTHVFAGLEYAVFSEYCRPIPSDVFGVAARKNPLPVAICMGGADASNKTLRVLEALVACDSPLMLWVLLGEGYGHRYDELVRCVRGRPGHEVVLAKTNRSMWQIMENCALAVLSGGLTTVEAVYAGLPSVNLFERQQHATLMAESFYDRGVCLNAGVIGRTTLEGMRDLVAGLEADRLRLLHMHQQSRGMIDDGGAVRVLRALQSQLEARA